MGATPSADPQGSYNVFLDAFGLSIDALESPIQQQRLEGPSPVISYDRGWSFLVERTTQAMGNVLPCLLDKESELVRKLRWVREPPYKLACVDAEGENSNRGSRNLYFSTALVDQVHDTCHIIEILSKRNFALRNEVLEMKSSVNLDAVAAVEKRVANLEVEVKRLRVEVELLRLH
ncbi:hypothetical protein B296_00043039 [Ensete ventricosum]|uniref:Uncharacterized protein n=1 Tax=Ensete ventricosum TaxID=4639 RepID=A0A426XYL1_ENSVE|nr:hypothetical protein B296_00043039 [Ensete ventricosum]